ncbi:MAG: hypothetical protein ACLFP1_02660 [Candidatus Goldiibacteriota bacterium]
MVMQGVRGNLFELFESQDKSVKDFMKTIKTGDTLRGRVIDIIANENKAIINFKGYNLVSELPMRSSVQKGDVINVEVSQLGDKIMMKLAPDAAVMGKGAEIQQGAEAQTSRQTADMLAALKVPVNEQNIFIARKLADYHLPVTKQNIGEINYALNRYMSDKGIDASQFKAPRQTARQSGIAREMALINLLKINAQAAKAAETLNSGKLTGEQAAALKQDTSAKIINMVNTLNIAAKSSGRAAVSVNPGGTSLSISDTAPETAAMLVKAAVSEGLIKSSEGRAIQNNISSGSSSAVGIMNKGASVSYGNNTLTINLNNIAENLASVIPRPAQGAVMPQAVSEKVFEPVIMNQQPSNPNAARDANQAQAQTQQPAQQTAPQTAPQNVSRQAVNILAANDTAVEQGISRIADSINMLGKFTGSNANALNEAALKDAGRLMNTVFRESGQLPAKIDNALSSMPMLNPEQGAQAREAAARLAGFINEQMSADQTAAKAFQGFNISGAETAALKQTITALADAFNNSVFAKNTQPSGQSAAGGPVFDVEAAIEALAFLKSRAITVENTKIIDVMNRYFSNEMKLNQSIEQFNGAVRDFAAMAQQTKPGDSARSISNMLSELSAAIENAAIKTQGRVLTGADMEGQLKNFIENSGMNIENRIKTMLLNRPAADAGAKNAGSPESAVNPENTAAMSRNIKPQLIKIDAELQKFENRNLTNVQRETAVKMGETVRDILNNMNAVQFINQKPAAFDMIYTQLPVFFENKYFNGELQVWYRKGSLKDALESAQPVNLVFMLNTSKLGNIKIKMTVYKSDIEAVIKTETPAAKQILMKNKNAFFENVREASFNMKVFNVLVDGALGEEDAPETDGYINLGSINMQA